jgi:hypothetical protein
MSTSPNEPSKLGGNTEARRITKGAAAAALAAFNASYLIEQSTRSQTISYTLLDSPVALAAWMLDHDTDSYDKISRAFLGGPPRATSPATTSSTTSRSTGWPAPASWPPARQEAARAVPPLVHVES